MEQFSGRAEVAREAGVLRGLIWRYVKPKRRVRVCTSGVCPWS
jgi:hypothetical protein